MIFRVANEEDTQRLAAILALHCKRGDCLLLRGDLGAGKTSFARGFIKALQPVKQDIVSPTFTLMQNYDGLDKAGNALSIAHFDLYRVQSLDEMEELGLDEALQNAIVLIEWPERAESLLPAGALGVIINPVQDSQQREITLAGSPEIWETRLHTVKEKY